MWYYVVNKIVLSYFSHLSMQSLDYKNYLLKTFTTIIPKSKNILKSAFASHQISRWVNIPKIFYCFENL